MKGLVFELTHSEGTSPSFLVGSMHVGDHRIRHLCDFFITLLDMTEAAAFEVDLSGSLPKVSDFIMPNSFRISDDVSAVKWEKICRYVEKSFSFDLKRFDTYYPLVILSLLQEQLMQKSSHFYMEGKLLQVAQEKDLKVFGLEDNKEHYDLIGSIPFGLQKKHLFSFIQKGNNTDKQFQKLLHHYMNGDIHTLYKMSKNQLGSLRGRMLYSRNRIMLSKIQKIIPEFSCMFAVGAAHLGGKKGLLHLLKEHGYKIRSIPILS